MSVIFSYHNVACVSFCSMYWRQLFFICSYMLQDFGELTKDKKHHVFFFRRGGRQEANFHWIYVDVKTALSGEYQGMSGTWTTAEVTPNGGLV